MPDTTSLAERSAVQAAADIARGALSAEEYTQACLERIADVEKDVQAFAYLDAGHALAQARALDKQRAEGGPLGPLHGVPVGIKDIFDTVDMPTESGSVLHSGRRPGRDATSVALLRQAGAVLIGKTVTTEFAVYAPGKTRNPRNPSHTPGGSSSGSAAAVATGMVPLAIGSQTNGSVIRPASYCGVWGYKPTFGLISRHGVLKLSRVLDHVGVFARTVEDTALIAQTLMGLDEHDPDTKPRAPADLLGAVRRGAPIPPKLAFVKTPVWDKADAETREAFAELKEALGEQVAEVDIPESIREAWDWQRTIMEADLAHNLACEHATGADAISATLREMIERGRKHTAVDYNRAVERTAPILQYFDEVLRWHTAIITPASPGPAPAGLESTGSPVFCTLWTYLGMPAVSIPLFEAPNGMPFGVQMVASRGDDARMLQTARWLSEFVA